MAAKKRKTHSEDFITKALVTLEKSQSEGRPVNEIAKQLGVSPSRLYYWKKRQDSNGSKSRGAARAPAEIRAPRAARTSFSGSSEVQALKRENAILKEECRILTKAALVFARQRN